MKITEQQLAAMLPTNKELAEWCDVLNNALPKYDIDTPQRIAAFVTQCAHESRDFTAMAENLNYRAETLLRVFPRYFGPGKRNPAEYERNSEKLANYVYMDEFRSKTGALGNVQPGDGWRFRGRGLKQLTGRNNYTRFAKDYGMTAEQASDWIETKEGALASALWFWSKNNLNPVADTGDVIALTKRINGGDIGLADRRQRYEKAMAVLAGSSAPSSRPAASAPGREATGGSALRTASATAVAEPLVLGARTLRRGDVGADVRALQAALGLTADGNFGPRTEAAVKAWQTQKGLTADGVVGPRTLATFA